MKTLLVLACILALVVTFQASSSGSHSKERRHFGRYHRPPSRRPGPPYRYPPSAYYPFRYPAIPAGSTGYFRQPGSPYIYVYVLPGPATAPGPGTTTTAATTTTSTTTAATTTTTAATTTTTAATTTGTNSTA